MHYEIVSGKKMLELCNNKAKIAEIKQEVEFTRIEYKGQSLFVEGVVYENDKTVCVVTKNVDFTEGRGPMVFHKVFKSMENAFDYIMSQSGIYGSQQGINNYSGVSIVGKPYCVSGFNGYDIKIVELE